MGADGSAEGVGAGAEVAAGVTVGAAMGTAALAVAIGFDTEVRHSAPPRTITTAAPVAAADAALLVFFASVNGPSIRAEYPQREALL